MMSPFNCVSLNTNLFSQDVKILLIPGQRQHCYNATQNEKWQGGGRYCYAFVLKEWATYQGMSYYRVASLLLLAGQSVFPGLFRAQKKVGLVELSLCPGVWEGPSGMGTIMSSNVLWWGCVMQSPADLCLWVFCQRSSPVSIWWDKKVSITLLWANRDGPWRVCTQFWWNWAFQVDEDWWGDPGKHPADLKNSVFPTVLFLHLTLSPRWSHTTIAIP